LKTRNIQKIFNVFYHLDIVHMKTDSSRDKAEKDQTALQLLSLYCLTFKFKIKLFFCLPILKTEVSADGTVYVQLIFSEVCKKQMNKNKDNAFTISTISLSQT